MGCVEVKILTDHLMVFFRGGEIDKNVNWVVSLASRFEA